MNAFCIVLAALGAAAVPGDDIRVLVDFDGETLPGFVRFNNTVPGAPRKNPDSPGREISFSHVDWPNVFFQAPEGVWDWSAHAGVGVRLFNPGAVPVNVALRLDNAGADGMRFCNNLRGSVSPGEWLDFRMWFNREGARLLWGMRGLPGNAQYGEGAPIDLTQITAFQLFLPQPDRAHTLILEKAYLFGNATDAPAGVSFPFVDPFGQYIHDQWPGKLNDAAEFTERVEQERKQWEAAPRLHGRDAWGGWAEGPRLEATGWFRTEQVDGKWWLVTPDGTLFLSLGVTCVGVWERTFVEGRADWFAWLPDRDDPVFGSLYSRVSGAHSMADVIGGEGDAFNFYNANLIRKYGDDWRDRWREAAYARLRHWGFNTIANWSQEDVLKESPLPYVVSTSLHNVRLIESATGYWSRMMDVYDPSFAENVESAVRYVAERHRDRQECLGYFVDNELAWEGVVDGVLSSGADQPARQALLAFLQERYETVAALNGQWHSDFASWEAVAAPSPRNETATQDLSDWFYAFAHRYFSVISDALRRHAPNQLYLGCRFASTPVEAVRACADVADVVSMNLYYPGIPPDLWTGDRELGKPIIIGEFHFGALDRGMFHTGLVAAKDQRHRAEMYRDYVRSVVDHPGFVGCHWFQYIDEPITGRWFDGENYNIGFVDVTDTPYPELVESARQVHGEVYTRRYTASPEIGE